MRLLLDSHAYIWWLTEDSRLGERARTAIGDPQSLVYVSAATIWEVSIKASLGKIHLGDADLVAEIVENDFIELPITARHADGTGKLPSHHDDPFDRMLIAQAQIEGLTCVTRDPVFLPYGVQTLW